MSNSNFCSQQRQQEEHKSRKLLAIGLFSSIVLHGAISSAAMRFNEEPKETKKPIELIIVDAPKPVPEVIKPKPEPQKQVKVIPPPPIPEPQKVKVTPPPIPEPQPTKTQPAKPKIENRQTPARSAQPRRVARVAPKPQAIKPQTITPPSPDVQPSPVQPSRPSVNPTPITNTQPQQQVLTGSNSSGTKVSVPDTPPSGTGNNGSFSGSSQSISGLGSSQGSNSQGTGDGTGGSNSGSSTPVAARPTPKPTPKARQALKCVRGCKVAYPSVLNGVEGSASVKVTVDSSGNVVNADLARSHSNSQINEQAIIAAQKMKFAPRSGESTASVRVTINFTVAGSDFERQARERQQQNERQRQAREQQQQQERQAREQQERQQQLERQARERQQQQAQPSPEPTTEAIPTPSVPDTPEL
ncbi:hypothetical protein C7H19_17930 [Aphanothece hegewaldii CCALA 016]|uniref:TonB C-terminal domain-containing protein n=1 Tax=Aphanothece hegewaldii CCALA 016 TaxID=2107694 RepID=A0A2T1LU91_9CHRO|nr:energy transducer TonB [Aphanothece hegewaldii]PSF35022.1 hypothetical protein C7H19_17930 [Aphanothece hegewaldii CCALA 016]